jgi:hypothetical protein
MDKEEKVVACFNITSQMFPEGLRKTKDPQSGELILGRDLNWVSLKCKSDALPSCHRRKIGNGCPAVQWLVTDC